MKISIFQNLGCNNSCWSPHVRRACVDSFRSLVLSPDWEKPYYRCCQAWMLLGNHAVALKLNSMGQDMCKSTSDLCRQKEEILVAMENSQR